MLRCGERPCLFATIVANAKIMLDIADLAYSWCVSKKNHKKCIVREKVNKLFFWSKQDWLFKITTFASKKHTLYNKTNISPFLSIFLKYLLITRSFLLSIFSFCHFCLLSWQIGFLFTCYYFFYSNGNFWHRCFKWESVLWLFFKVFFV